MGEPLDVTPAFITTPKGDEIVIMTRAYYDRLTATLDRSVGNIANALIEDAGDVAEANRRRRAWTEAGKPTVPLAVIRRVRAGDSYLKAFRSYRGLTQAALAEKAGVGQGYISEIESAAKNPTDETRHALAAALDIHPVFLSDAAPLPEGQPV